MSDKQPSVEAGKPVLWPSMALLAFAAALWWWPVPFADPVLHAPPVPSWVTDPTPVRQPTLRPEYQAGVFTYRCGDCHRVIVSPAETQRPLTQHTEIELRHGINTRCFNCHHRTNRDAFVDDFGGEIAWDQPQLVCAKCHGPVYRDWQHGVHGRTNGYWNKELGVQTRRRCIECHDPHQPPFPALAPAAAPHTLRTERRFEGERGGDHSPLRLSDQAAFAPGADTQGEDQ